jgi:hypothetical protein
MQGSGGALAARVATNDGCCYHGRFSRGSRTIAFPPKPLPLSGANRHSPQLRAQLSGKPQERLAHRIVADDLPIGWVRVQASP